MTYAELQISSNFSFLRGASHAEELALTAAHLGLGAIAITDRNTLAGVVRAHAAAKLAGIRLVIGCRLDLRDAQSLLCYPTDRDAYGRLCRLLTLGKRRTKKGGCDLSLADVMAHAEGQVFAIVPPAAIDPTFPTFLEAMANTCPGQVYLAMSCLYRGDDRRRISRLLGLAQQFGLPPLATNDVHCHISERRALQDVLTCIREHCVLTEAGFRLFGNAERHLKPPAEMARLFASCPEAITNSMQLAARCNFSLDELRYEYPETLGANGKTPQQILTDLAWSGAETHYPRGVPEKIRAAIRHELQLIDQLDYAPYFLTVYDIVRFARSRGILCQGRGSAANSVVCYCIGITAVDPVKIDLLFERFISAERNEPPDIDVDFEHERREEVIQYIYNRYGRARAGIAATVISYRGKSAVREVAKVFGLSADTQAALAGSVWHRPGGRDWVQQMRELGLDPKDKTLRKVARLTEALIGFPRHLSQHVGGFVITRGLLEELCPIGNAAMDDRTFIEWDKDDIDALGILKVDVLALGMLTCIRKAFDLIARHKGQRWTLNTLPPEDPAVYAMLSQADSLGVFQVESRAQMTMLPRLKPKEFYDLVIEVAIVRPGPIQGNMVHPYLRRRNGEQVSYPRPAIEFGAADELERVLGKTLGVPLFQEQAMRIAIVAAKFTPGEADQLRRAMATFRRTGTIHTFQQKMVQGMVARGYDQTFAESCFKQIEGFGEYGFPESHAASFALLVYASAWLKCHEPAVFAAALLNSQPMGFYAPAQIVRDVRDHGVTVLPVDINQSDFDCTLEPEGERFALRLGFRQIKGFQKDWGDRLVMARPFTSLADAAKRAFLTPNMLERLVDADACRSLGLDRRHALWQVKALGQGQLGLFDDLDADLTMREAHIVLPAMRLGEHVVEDYNALRLSLKAHPMALLRSQFEGPLTRAADLLTARNNSRVTVAGLVLVRQRPGTANGVVFITIEDETGPANIIVWPDKVEAFRKVVLGARLISVTGRLQREGLVIHVVSDQLVDKTAHLALLGEAGADMPVQLSRADEVKHAAVDVNEMGRLASSRKVMPKSRDFH